MAVLTPYLAVADARAAMDWYVAHLDAAVVVEPITMPDGRVGHVELAVAGARWMMSDEHPELAVEAPDRARGPGACASTAGPRTRASAGWRSSATRSGTAGS